MKKKYVKPQAIEVPVAVECLADFATSNGVKASQPSDKSSCVESTSKCKIIKRV